MYLKYKFILLLIMYSSLLSNGLQIAEHFAQPNLVANCSRTELHCSLTGTADAQVSWTFHGENAARLPSAHIQRDYADARWRLIIDCTTIRHAGTYVCNAHASGKKEIVYRKEAVVQVYVPVQVNIDQPQIKQSNRNSAKLQCNVTGYPRVSVSWFKLQRNNNPSYKSAQLPSNANQETNSDQLLKLYQQSIRFTKNHHNVQSTNDYDGVLTNVLEGGPIEIQLGGILYRYVQINGTVDSKFAIENRMLEQFDDSQMQSMLTINRLDVNDAGVYVCRARNAYSNSNENGFGLIVLETPKLRLVSSGSLSSRSIELKLAILHNSNAPCQELIIALRNNSQTIVNSSSITTDIDLSNSSPNDWIIVDIINLKSDQAGNVIGGSIVEQQNQTDILLNQYLDNQNILSVNSSSLNQFFDYNQQSTVHSKQTRNSKHDSSRSINRFELIEPNVVRYIINNLQPKADYSVQVLAQNQVGRSAIASIKVETQPDVPSRVKNVHILTRTNETLLYGWKRSADNGAEINRYEVQLAYGQPDNWLRNETKDVNLTSGNSSGPPRNNYMYIFVGLRPGSTYYFRVRACNEIGCSEYSEPPLLGITQDGFSDPPENIRIKCFAQNQKQHQQNSNSKDTSLDIQPLIQYSTSTNSGEQATFDNQQYSKYQKESQRIITNDDDQLSGTDDESNEQNSLNRGRSSPTAELLRWPFEQQSSQIETTSKRQKRSTDNQSNSVKNDLSSQIIENHQSNVNNTNDQRIHNDQQTNDNQVQNYVTISWMPPVDARGTVLGWNITLDGLTRYINEENKEMTERYKLIYEIRSNITNEFTIRVNPNTRYQVRMCAVNRAGCGKLSSFSLNSQCDSAPVLNKDRLQNLQVTLGRLTSPMINNYPRVSSQSLSTPIISDGDKEIRSKNNNKVNIEFAKNNQLVLNLQRLSERDGPIICYRIVMIRLPKYGQLINYLSSMNGDSGDGRQLNFNQTNSINITDSKFMNNTQSNEIKFQNDSLTSRNDRFNKFDMLSILPSDPMHVPVYRYEQFSGLNYSSSNQANNVRKQDKLIKNTMYLTYLTKEMSSSQFHNEIIIGDKTASSCSPDCTSNTDQLNHHLSSNQKNASFYAMTSNSPVASARSTLGRRCVYNGELEPETNYTGFVEIHISGFNGTRLVQRSGYFKPIQTGSQPQQITPNFKTISHLTTKIDKLFLDKLNILFGHMSDHAATVVFSTICGLILLLLLFLCFVLCCLKRKTSSTNRNQSSPKLVDKKTGKAKKKSTNKPKERKSKKDNVEEITDLDKSFSSSETQINEDNIKSNENELINNSSNKVQSIDHANCLNLNCEQNNYVIDKNNDQWQVSSDSFPSPPIIVKQQNIVQQSQPITSYQQHLILIDATTNQPILTHQNHNLSNTITADPIHFVHLKQPINDHLHLTNLHDQNCGLTNNLININNNLSYDTYASTVLPSYNHIEQANYYINSFVPQQQQSIDNESTTNSVNNSSLNDNESADIQLASHQLSAHKWIAAEFPMKSIHEVFLERSENDDQLFQIEFASIPMQFQDRNFNSNPLNKTKNRFENIKCFNETRVRLNMKQVSFSQTVSTMPRQSSSNTSSASGFSGTLTRTLRRKKKANSIDSNDTTSSNNSSTNSKKQDDSSITSNSPSILSNNQQQSTNSDYIHANHVHLNDSSYICTQAPLPDTVRDFWQMIVEQGVNIIVALCDLEEDDRQVCSSYWNESNVDGGLKQFGEIRIQLVSSRKYADYVLRRFSLTKRNKNNQQNNEICREIVQFQYFKWNEYANSGEQPSWLLCFIGKINEFFFENNHQSSSPMLVHCEDGCGRSGQFIAVRSLMAMIQYNKYQDNLYETETKQSTIIKQSTLNIFELVSLLRYQRYMLVDSIAQYIFIYRACLEYIKFGLDDLNDSYVEQHIKMNSLDYYSQTNRFAYGLLTTNPVNDIVTINYHNITSAPRGNIIPEFDV